MRHIKLYYSITMFVLTSLMLLLLPICHDMSQYSLVGFMLVIGYTVSILSFTWWRDDRKQDNGPFYDSAGFTEADR